MAALTREQMVAEINAGRSILFSPTTGNPGGSIATTLDALPSEAALAAASEDPARKAAAREHLVAMKQKLDDEIASLDRPAPAPVAAPDPEPAAREAAPAEAPKTPKGK